MKAKEFIRGRYLHMKRDEAVIWTRFLTQTDLEFEHLIYDLHLEEGQPVLPSDSPPIVALKQAVTRKRVDAVGETANAFHIFEVKPRIGMSALGQLINYERLFREEWRPQKPVYLHAVGERLEPDVAPAFFEARIRIILV